MRNASALAILPLLLLAPAAYALEAPDSACASAQQLPEVLAAKADVQRTPEVLAKRIKLSDLLVGAGCYQDAVQLLEAAQVSNPGNTDLQFRLSRVRSMVREKRYFEGLDQAQALAQLRRSALRCTQLADVAACDEILAQRPGNVNIMLAKGNALLAANRIAEAIETYTRASQLAPNSAFVAQKLQAAQSRADEVGAAPSPVSPSPPQKLADAAPRRTTFSNTAPASRSN